MSKESLPQHNAHVLEEERKGIADNLAEQDTIRRCDAEVSASALKHEQKAEAKKHEVEAKHAKHNAKDLHDQAKSTAQALKDQTKANAEKVKL